MANHNIRCRHNGARDMAKSWCYAGAGPFPFSIKDFHADNGAKYVNQWATAPLVKLCAEFSRSGRAPELHRLGREQGRQRPAPCRHRIGTATGSARSPPTPSARTAGPQGQPRPAMSLRRMWGLCDRVPATVEAA